MSFELSYVTLSIIFGLLFVSVHSLWKFFKKLPLSTEELIYSFTHGWMLLAGVSYLLFGVFGILLYGQGLEEMRLPLTIGGLVLVAVSLKHYIKMFREE